MADFIIKHRDERDYETHVIADSEDEAMIKWANGDIEEEIETNGYSSDFKSIEMADR